MTCACGMMPEHSLDSPQVENKPKEPNKRRPDPPAQQRFRASRKPRHAEQRVERRLADSQPARSKWQAIGNETQRDDENHLRIQTRRIQNVNRQHHHNKQQRIGHDGYDQRREHRAEVMAIGRDRSNHFARPVFPGQAS